MPAHPPAPSPVADLHVDPRTFAFKRWTDLRYYEACTSAEIYEHLEKTKTTATPALAR